MENSEYRILLVDDEADILEFVSYNLKKEKYIVHTSTNGADALKKAKEIKPHLIMLDVMMPGIDGVETCNIMRSMPELNNTVIVFLTARGEDYSQIAGFDAGADDYITKPIKPKVLISRIKALLRRYVKTEVPESLITIGSLTIDKERYLVIKDDVEIILPHKEFELLFLLTSKPNKVFTRDEIYAKVWGSNIVVGDRTIDVHIRKVREKIGIDNVKTIKGVGYKYEA